MPFTPDQPKSSFVPDAAPQQPAGPQPFDPAQNQDKLRQAQSLSREAAGHALVDKYNIEMAHDRDRGYLDPAQTGMNTAIGQVPIKPALAMLLGGASKIAPGRLGTFLQGAAAKLKGQAPEFGAGRPEIEPSIWGDTPQIDKSGIGTTQTGPVEVAQPTPMSELESLLQKSRIISPEEAAANKIANKNWNFPVAKSREGMDAPQSWKWKK